MAIAPRVEEGRGGCWSEGGGRLWGEVKHGGEENVWEVDEVCEVGEEGEFMRELYEG